jgi:cytochrome c oxidase subunit 2
VSGPGTAGSHPRRARPGTLLRGACLAAIATGCVPRPATAQGQSIADLWVVFGVASAAVGLVVWGLVTWSVLRYRARGSDELPVQTHGHLGLEIAWTAIPVAIVAGLFVLTYRTIGTVDTAPSSPAVAVKVTAFTWQWSFHYEGTDVTVVGEGNRPPELVVPVGEPVRVTLVSADVDHAFYVPAFLFKRDAIPGHPSTFDFTVVAPGVYRGQCAEFCGLQHDTMAFTVRAVDRATFDAWLAGGGAGPGASPSPGGSAASPSPGGSAASPSPGGSAP